MFRDIVLWHLDKKILKLENELAELRMLKRRLLNMKEIVMPHMGVVVETGKIVKWLVKEGDFVKEGEPLFDVETEKVNITIDSKDAGIILKIIHKKIMRN